MKIKKYKNLIFAFFALFVAVVVFIAILVAMAFGWFANNTTVSADGMTFELYNQSGSNIIGAQIVNGNTNGENVILPGEVYAIQITPNFEEGVSSDETTSFVMTISGITLPEADDIDGDLLDYQDIVKDIDSLPLCTTALKVCMVSSITQGEYLKTFEEETENVTLATFTKEGSGDWTAEISFEYKKDTSFYILLYFDPDICWKGENDTTSHEHNSNGFFGQKFTLSYKCIKTKNS
jgi:hypothetical protein